MTILFWILWVTNVLLLLLAIVGKGFRSSFGAGVDLNVLSVIILMAILASSLILRYAYKLKWISLAVVSIPLIIMLVWYLFEKWSGKSR